MRRFNNSNGLTKRFNSHLHNILVDGFPATEAWLRRNKCVDANQRHAKAITIINAYMEFLDWNVENEFPETMAMDKDRMVALAARALRIGICASVLAVGANVPVIGQQAANKKSLKEQIDILLLNVKDNK